MYTGFWWVKPEGKRLLGRHRRRCEDNIKIDLQEVGWGEWTGLIWLTIGTGGGALVNAVMDLRLPQNTGNFVTAENKSASQEGLCSME